MMQQINGTKNRAQAPKSRQSPERAIDRRQLTPLRPRQDNRRTSTRYYVLVGLTPTGLDRFTDRFLLPDYGRNPCVGYAAASFARKEAAVHLHGPDAILFRRLLVNGPFLLEETRVDHHLPFGDR